MEREARSGSEIVSRSRPKPTTLVRSFRGRVTARSTNSLSMLLDSGSRERAAALCCGILTVLGVAAFMHSVVGYTSTLGMHSVTGTSALAVGGFGVFSWSLDIGRPRLRWIHAGIMASFFATLNAAVGLALKMRLDSGGAHFISLHSWMGVASLVLAKIAFADAAASLLAGAAGFRTFYGYKVPTFNLTRHVAAAGGASIAATLAIVLGVAQMQNRVNASAKSAGRSLLRIQSIAPNFLALGAIATLILTIVAVRKRQATVHRDRERDAPKLLESDDEDLKTHPSPSLGV